LSVQRFTPATHSVFFYIGIACFAESCCLCAVKTIIWNVDYPVKVTHAVFKIEKTFVIKFMVKRQLRGIALCFVFFKITVDSVALSLYKMYIATDTVFNGVFNPTFSFVLSAEINK
jgi:hypothetical protein